MRVGFGYDVHQIVEGRKLFLGGVEIPFDNKGLLGHSDADVLLHAICDALLGAAALGDIGKHFPDTSDDYKNIDSKILLIRTYELLKRNNYQISNIDCTLCMEKPKIAPYIPQMQKVISEILDIELNQISIKATTKEKMGFVGRGEGAEAYAVCLITRVENV
ncbi:MAG TPA: 2-C-methyl-D-erythritol 2,4-cyclodiphosphate synthase [Ignavibacteriales bacterium]|nr:2-C-methyl-D-erythritol 2,4-cyclodiphosphate synthase [Ignavibacteriales bacterium]HOL82191.1 2-C-methyl-D-erythritol 2,4-cyclodiphosphate synthase [Ignavibacteriales bacterium]HOM66311.1 2-C-methyl-D-erythritol 2,4-cyclodiphosphate synthase [Ignavibacteriales bacterium]HPD67992.1 2-C-methyl-D-erythritol 2,4-cyclodiphosphate synthase [Ignavibacteriales bacterium]HPP34430.1 2-C-methyl-D-erythritol 2,4-cyclodiphosphate synthase [Ignavibacteriales bacterium]